MQTFSGATGSYAAATANLRVVVRTPTTLNFSSVQNAAGGTNTNAPGLVVDGQRSLYQVTVPATLNGAATLGWKLSTSTTQGTAGIYVYSDATNLATPIAQTTERTLILAPPLFAPGTYIVEVRANGATNFTVTSEAVVPRNAATPWTLPTAATYANANDIGDSGTLDLANGDYDFYAVTVPDGNAGVLRTVIEAVSGNPDLYLRRDAIPSRNHIVPGGDADIPYNGTAYSRSLVSTTGTEYGNWVPYNLKTETQLKPGKYYLAVHAASNTNVRYRLRVSPGAITAVPLNGGSVTGQLLTAGDWRYYKFVPPADGTMPQSWSLTFRQVSGDAVMFLRDTTPPGFATNSNVSTAYNYDTVQDWQRDQKDGDVSNFNRYDNPGTYTFTTPPLRPGTTYYVGFYAKTDSNFGLSSAVSGSVAVPTEIPYFTGSLSNVTIPAGGNVLYRMVAPTNAGRLKFALTPSATIELAIEQGTLPTATGTVHYRNPSFGPTSGSFDYGFAGWPWVPGATYYLRLANPSASAVTFSLTSDSGRAAILQGPSNVAAAAGGNATFTVVAGGSPAPTYQWRRNGVNLVEGGRLTGTQTPTLTITGVLTSDNGSYDVVVANTTATGPFSTQAGATLSVDGTPLITSQPVDATAAANGSSSFGIGVYSRSSLTYQWQRSTDAGATWGNLSDATGISGSTGPNLYLSSVALNRSGERYRAVLTNALGVTTSSAATLLVQAPPTIQTQPTARTVPIGQSTTFSVVATGTPTPTYQWRKNGSNIAAATGATYTIPSVQTGDAGNYSVYIANVAGNLSSDIVALTVVSPAAPVINSPLNVTAQQGVAFTYTLTATNFPLSFNAAGLPPGLTVNPTTGMIQGTPTGSGQYGVSVSVANTVGSDSKVLTINVAPSPPVITSSLSGSAFVGAVYGYTITATNSPTSYNATGLPPGLAVNTATGAISGTPTANGTYNVTIAAANSGGVDSKTLVLTVTLPPAPVLSGSFTTAAKLRFPYTYAITASNNPTSYNATGLPPGLTINPATGAIIGAPTGLGTYLVTIAAANAGGVASTTLTIAVTKAPQDSLLSGTQSDLLLENNVTGERVIWQMNGASITTSAALPTFTAGWHFAGTGDFNGDGRADIVLQNTISGDRVVWLMNGATISSSASFPTLPLVWQIACVGDLNNDGKPDVILQNTATNERVAWLMNGTAIASSFNLPTLPAAWQFCGILDFNGDGLPDLLLQNTDTGERIIWLLNAQLAITQSLNLPTFYEGWRFAGVGRFTADNRPNIILQNTLTGERVLWSISATGAITASTALPTLPVTWSFAGPALNRAKAPVAGDLNRDGKPDILVTDATSGDRILWLMNAATITGSVALPNLPSTWQIMGTGDFNGDGMNDVLLQNTGTGERYLWLMNGTTVAGAVALPTLPTAWSLAAVGDINQDGQPDIVLENRSSGERLIWFMDRLSISASVALPTLPVSWTIAAAGSFTANGNPNLLLENTASGERTFWVLNPAGTLQQSLGLPTFLGGWRFAGSAPFFGGAKPHILMQNLTSGERLIWRMDNTSISASSSLPYLPINYILRN
jgi:hypothetical protein